MKYVLDTHPLLWFIQGDSRLGPNAKAVLDTVAADLILPATAFAEACWIVEHGRTAIPDVTTLLSIIATETRISIALLDAATVERSLTLTAIHEMHDRQIVATALLLAGRGEQVTLLTRDQNITNSGLVPVVW